MGNDLRKHICCVTCGGCRKQELEEGNEGTSETKPILQVSGKTSMGADLQTSPPALEALQQGSGGVQAPSQHQQPSAAAVEADVESCCVADPMGMAEECQAAWHCTGFLVAPAGRDSKGDGEVLTQADNQQEREEVSGTEEKPQHVPHASEAQPAAHSAQEEKLAADQEQAEEVEVGSELSPCAGTALQERNLLNLMEFPSDTAAGQDLEIKSSAGEILIGRSLLLSSVLEESEIYFSADQGEEMQWAELAAVSPQATETAEQMPETTALETLQLPQKAGETVDPSEVLSDDTTEMYFTPTAFWPSPCPEGESLKPANQLLVFFQQDIQSGVLAAQEMESLHSEELSEVLQQSGHRVLGEQEGKESRECGAEAAASQAEPQHWNVQQAKELPDKTTCVQVLVEEGIESPGEASRLPEELGSSTEAD